MAYAKLIGQVRSLDIQSNYFIVGYRQHNLALIGISQLGKALKDLFELLRQDSQSDSIIDGTDLSVYEVKDLIKDIMK